MIYDKNLYQQIDDFLDGKMEPTACQVFAEEIARNPNLAEEVNMYRLSNEVVNAAASNELRREIQSGIRSFDRKQKFKKWTIASILLVLTIGAVLIYLYSDKKKSNRSKKTEITTHENKLTEHKTVLTDTLENKVEPFVKEKPILKKQDTRIVNTEEQRDSIQSDDVAVISIPDTTDKTIEPGIIQTPPIVIEDTAKARPINCSDFKVKSQPEVLATCQGKYEGVIDFSGTIVTGGKKPYTLESSISNTNKLEKFTNLPAGNYSFKLSDAQGCNQNIQVEVLEKICFQKDFIINTSLGEKWQPPVGNSEIYDLQIIDVKGKIVFGQNRVSNFEWVGTDNYGQLLSSGLYVYLIKLDDQKIHNGQITIIR